MFKRFFETEEEKNKRLAKEEEEEKNERLAKENKTKKEDAIIIILNMFRAIKVSCDKIKDHK